MVPEPPWFDLKIEGVYRSSRSDQAGNYELRGLIPAGYRVHVWPNGENPAYFDDTFMKGYEGRGQFIRMEEFGVISINLSLPG